MDKFKKTILVCIIIILMIIIGIICILYKQNINNDNLNIIEQQNGEEGEQINFETVQTEVIKDNAKYYTVTSCISDYLGLTNLNSSAYYGYNENNKYSLIIDKKTIKQYIYNVLSREYIDKYNVTIDNVLEYVDETNDNVNFIPLKMNVLAKKNVEKYIVHGIETDIDNKYLKDMYIIVNLDLNNNTFSIEPINKKYDSIDEIEVSNKIENIKENDNNLYLEMKIDNEYLCKDYLDKYKKLSIAKPELAYEYLNKEFRDKRFGNLEEFKKYINKHKNKIISTQCTKYYVEEYGQYTQYVIQDKYENLYIFDVNTITDFSIKLDTYTITTEKFKETYNSSNDIEKVKMNIDKFFQMINRQDYKTSFDCLSSDFKKNNFINEDEFEKIVREKFFLYNKIEFIDCNKQGNGLYVCRIRLTDLLGESKEKRTNNIIMKLSEDLNFEMSFNIK